VVLVVAIAVLGLFGDTLPSLAKLFSLSPLAPPPSPTALRGFQSSPLGTPVPLPAKPLVTATPVPAVIPTIPSPPGWPTGVPWPLTPEPLTPTSTPRPFPTLELPPVGGERPAVLQTIWFPYYPALGSTPQMQAVFVDQRGQQWAQPDSRLDLVLPAPNVYGLDPGPILTDLHLSPTGRWLIADFTYTGSRLVDMPSMEEVRLLASDQWYFLAWHPDGRQVLISTEEGLLLSNLASTSYTALDYYPRPEFERTQICALAYSPNGMHLADAVVYPAVHGVRNVEMAEIGLRTHGEERRTLVQIPGGTYVLDHSLQWSPDSQRFIWIVNVVPNEAGPVRLENMQTQLWIADLSNGNVRMLAVLGEAVEYKYPAVWSPNGQHVAALIIGKAQDSEVVGDNVFLLDPESGAVRQITDFVNEHLSHLTWSPDSQWLAFTVSKGEYGEIWVTNIAGTQQYPVAGPTLPDAPFVWLPEGRGGE